jgi:DNA primase catalytic core, N-terminal domain
MCYDCHKLMDIPPEYILSNFYLVANDVEKSGDVYIGGCPVCHEGRSWGRKKRMCFIPEFNYVVCHNCGGTWKPYSFLTEVCGIDSLDINKEIKEYTGENPMNSYYERVYDNVVEKKPKDFNIPNNSVNLLDYTQMAYHKDNAIIRYARRLLDERRLITAKYRPKTFYVPLDDFVHENRLLIPFYNLKGDIIYYQTRRLKNDETAKYLSKISPEKEVFNVDKIDMELPYVFIVEGPIDTMFLKNAVGICGLKMTTHQEQQIRMAHPSAEWVWVMDNPEMDANDTVKQIYKDKIKEERDLIFCWGNDFYGCKDLNDYAIKHQLDEIPTDVILKKSFKGSNCNLNLSFS